MEKHLGTFLNQVQDTIHKTIMYHWLKEFKLFICGAEKSQVLHLNLTLIIFESLSGLHINMLMSTIYPVNDVPNLGELAAILSCRIGSFPTIYLGLPLGAKSKSIQV